MRWSKASYQTYCKYKNAQSCKFSCHDNHHIRIHSPARSTKVSFPCLVTYRFSSVASCCSLAISIVNILWLRLEKSFILWALVDLLFKPEITKQAWDCEKATDREHQNFRYCLEEYKLFQLLYTGVVEWWENLKQQLHKTINFPNCVYRYAVACQILVFYICSWHRALSIFEPGYALPPSLYLWEFQG